MNHTSRKTHKVLTALLALLLLLTLLSCDAGDGAETSGVPDESTPDETTAAMIPTEELGAAVGGYEWTQKDVTLRVDICSVSRAPGGFPASGSRVEGTLTITNRSGAEMTGYVHAFVGASAPEEQAEPTASSAPKTPMSDAYETVTEDAPHAVTIASGASVTVNFSVEIPPEIADQDLLYYLTLALCEGETFGMNGAVAYAFFRVH